MQELRNDSKSIIAVTGRLYFIDTNFAVCNDVRGQVRLILRNGNRDYKTMNRIATMCGFKKKGPLQREGDIHYYRLEAR